MNGGIPWNDGWQLSYQSRERIIKKLNKISEQISGKEYM